MLWVLSSAAFLLCCAAGGLAARWYYVRRRRRQMEEEVNEARETLLEMQALLKQPGWVKLAEAAQKHIEAKRNEVLLKPTDNLADDNYMKGEIQGISLFVQIPRQLIELNKDILESAKRLEEEGA